ncbi:MAG: CPBP family intramembrane metalloprotease [Ruminococcaceae bacterium]|nr:CPBP family intramembrane metalloprotease [Oscillospiraceae bacterium]
MLCPNCQNEILPHEKFCTRCGMPIRRESAAAKRFKALCKAVLYVLVFLIVQSVVSGAYSAALTVQTMLNNGGIFDESDMEAILENVMANLSLITLISAVLTILVLALLFALRRKNLFTEASIRPVPISTLLICAAMGTAFNIVISITIGFLPLPESWLLGLEEQYSYLGEGSSLILEILSTVVLTGFVEEVVFRGLVDSRLKRAFPKGIVILISCILFGVCHGTPIAILYAAVVGILFSLLTWRYDSILPSVTAHMFFNLTSFWLVSENDILLLGLYFISIAVMIVTLYVLFRKPAAANNDNQ